MTTITDQIDVSTNRGLRPARSAAGKNVRAEPEFEATARVGDCHSADRSWGEPLPHRNRGQSKRVDLCAPSVEDRSALAQLEKLYFPEFQRLRRLTGGRWQMRLCPA
eukprot:s145_g23.t3